MLNVACNGMPGSAGLGGVVQPSPPCVSSRLMSSLPLHIQSAGDAGTGKSFLLNRIIAELREEYGTDFGSAVGVTAATGGAGDEQAGSAVVECGCYCCCLLLRQAAW